MRVGGYNLGGEPSGHILLPNLARSGDGLLAALQILALLEKEGKPASKLFHTFVPSAQRTENLWGIDLSILQNSKLLKKIEKIEHGMVGKGRVLVRPSGTEDLVRVMVEAKQIPFLTSVWMN